MLDVLKRIVLEVNVAQDLPSALNIIVAQVTKAMGTQVCTIYLLDESGHYIFMATEGLNKDAVGKVRIHPSEGLVGLVGERAEPVNLDDAQNHPRYLHIADVGEEPFRSFLGVPIIHHRTVLGVLVVQQQQARRYDESEEAFLITLSAQLSGVIAHAKATGSMVEVHQLAESAPVSTRFDAVPGAPGIAIGTVRVLFPRADLKKVPERRVTDIDQEVKQFRSALTATRKEIRSIAGKLNERLPKAELALFDAYLYMLDKNAIGGEVVRKIKEGYWSQTALRMVIEKHVETFNAMEDIYLKERAADVRDLGQRVLANLQLSAGTAEEFPDHTILVGEELTPSMIAQVPERKLAGIVSIQGSSNSHVAILARAIGLPTVMGALDLPIGILDGQPMIVDGFSGRIICHPGKVEIKAYRKIALEEQALVGGLAELKDLPAETPDGHQVTLCVNTGLKTDVFRSLDRGAQGVGLYRTEVYFQMIERFPTEEEQRKIYREHLEAFSPLPVTMRTLDIGGDKSLAYFPIEEENPFLGWRGIRVTLDHPDIFLAQIRAMIRAHEGLEGELKIMLPMISSILEVDEALHLIEQCYQEVIEEGVAVDMPDVGVMIEVPAAVFQAKAIIKRVDFLSVGSNDLTQYMLAVDRNNAHVAGLYQHFHPSVLHALKQIVDVTKAAKKPVSICGEMAGSPGAAILLMAMGYDQLSMSATSLPIVKCAIRSVSSADARAMLKTVLKMDHALAIKNFVDDRLREFGLEKLLR